jgi:hypothetical protein
MSIALRAISESVYSPRPPALSERQHPANGTTLVIATNNTSIIRHIAAWEGLDFYVVKSRGATVSNIHLGQIL